MREKPTDREKILMLILTDGPQFSFHLRGRQTPQGVFLGHQGDRRARELAAEGLLDAKHQPLRPDGTGPLTARYSLSVEGRHRAEMVYEVWEERLGLAPRIKPKPWGKQKLFEESYEV